MRKSLQNRRDPLSQGKWRRYANDHHEAKNQHFSDFMHRCNERAKVISHRAQIGNPAYDDAYWEDEIASASVKTHWYRLLLAVFVLLPANIICISALIRQLTETKEKLSVLLSEPIWYIMLGCLVIVFMALFKVIKHPQFVYFYVLGHELTHAIAIKLCMGKISGFGVKASGGHVLTDKNNIFIALSPYFIPLWAVLWAGLYAVVNFFHPIDNLRSYLYFGVGIGWAFHVYWTIMLIPRDQPDLKENGQFFSYTLIYFINLLLIIAMLVLCDIFTIREFAGACVRTAGQYGNLIADLVALLK